MKWTSEEVTFVENHYRARGALYCASKLNRTAIAIASKVKRDRKKMGLDQDPDVREAKIYSCYWKKILCSAKRRGIKVEVSPEYVLDLYKKQNGRCVLTGVKLVMARNSKEWKLRTQTASLDRIDSSKGYVEGNLQWIHKKINQIKSNSDQDEFIKYCLMVADNMRTKV